MKNLKKIVLNKTLSLVRGDITERKVDAIVNAANSYLRHGGGVADAIVRKGGAIIQKESNKLGYVPVGSAVITTGGNLHCKLVIHAVGPQMGEGDEDDNLRKAIQSIMKLASEKKLSSISIPAISSGIFGFPKERCAKILVEETLNFTKENQNTSLQLIEFCIYDDQTYKFFEDEFNLITEN